MAKALKVYSAKPDGRSRRRIVKETTSQRIARIRKELGKWEALKITVKMQSYATGI